MISRIGKKAGVVVNKADGKFASAHDLRRSFGTRWAKRVMPAVLKRLMRHAAIQTTMSFYVDLDAAEVADQLWASYGNTPAAGNTLGNTGPKMPPLRLQKRSQVKAMEYVRKRAPPGFEPGMADLQSAALAAWLRRLGFLRLCRRHKI